MSGTGPAPGTDTAGGNTSTAPPGSRRARVLVAKLGLDGHDRGAKVVAQTLRDAGMEVIYTGLRRSAQDVVAVAIEEDVDVIGLSVLSGTHLALARQVLDELTHQSVADEIPAVIGGTISKNDATTLREMGIADVFGVRSPLDELAPRVQALVDNHR